MQYGWHICNQNIVPQISCVVGVPGEYCRVHYLNLNIEFNVCRRKPEPPEETYAVRESRPLYHMRNGFDRESNPRPQR
jgi:hypothetical protein